MHAIHCKESNKHNMKLSYITAWCLAWNCMEILWTGIWVVYTLYRSNYQPKFLLYAFNLFQVLIQTVREIEELFPNNAVCSHRFLTVTLKTNIWHVESYDAVSQLLNFSQLIPNFQKLIVHSSFPQAAGRLIDIPTFIVRRRYRFWCEENVTCSR